MNREILFRGKRSDTAAWETGSLVVIRGGCSDEQVYIADKMTGYHTPVMPSTVGQYTGLDDVNGKMIFKGDIVVMNIKGCNTICKVAWADSVAQFQLWQTNTIPHTSTALNLGNYDCEVIGNIHDNPELLWSDNNAE